MQIEWALCHLQVLLDGTYIFFAERLTRVPSVSSPLCRKAAHHTLHVSPPALFHALFLFTSRINMLFPTGLIFFSPKSLLLLEVDRTHVPLGKTDETPLHALALGGFAKKLQFTTKEHDGEGLSAICMHPLPSLTKFLHKKEVGLEGHCSEQWATTHFPLFVRQVVQYTTAPSSLRGSVRDPSCHQIASHILLPGLSIL